MKKPTAELVIERRIKDGQSVASKLYAKYPLRLHVTSRPNSHINDSNNNTKCLYVYSIGYGGGLVNGDEVVFDMHVKEGSGVCITSQGMNRVYHGTEGAKVFVNSVVEENALLILIPQPTQCFANSRLVQQTNITLNYNNSQTVKPSLCLVDWYTGGRCPTFEKLWSFDSYSSIVEVRSCNNCNSTATSTTISKKHSNNIQLRFRDSTFLSGGSALAKNMLNYKVVGLVLLVGPRVQKEARALYNEFGNRCDYVDDSEVFLSKEGMHVDGMLISCGKVAVFETGVDNCSDDVVDGVVLRLAAPTVEQASDFLSSKIGNFSDQVDGDPFQEILAAHQESRLSSVATNDSGNKSSAENIMSKRNEKIKTLTPVSGLLMRSGLFVSHQQCDDDEEEEGEGKTKSSSTSTKKDSVPGVDPIIMFQLVDSGVPTGGFAHSNTLECASQFKMLNCDNYSLSQHVENVIVNTICTGFPYLLKCIRLMKQQSPNRGMQNNIVISPEVVDSWGEMDKNYHATIPSHVSRRASSVQGSGMLRAYSHAFIPLNDSLKHIKRKILQMSLVGEDKGHAVTVFGAVCGLLGIDELSALKMFLYVSIRDMVSAAVRMNLIGPLEGGRLIHQLCDRSTSLLSNLNIDLLAASDGFQVAPLVEILANAHDRLYTRLFNS